ncbi:MAG TPA: bifunctional phosphoglucose/phosphomannose isomerase [Candidatus Cloacimonadota bacterium]|nr:bifunctional phosphoglucose/phosphomannose isomerase [Candidatus Cloacimonadota bacterium]HPK40031.1 bifunctional phosphoglucose/phosphomannose isomerase [Candidatus Cloacimonadota bacterium]
MIDLDDLNAIAQLDKEGMGHMIIHMPEQAWQTYFEPKITNIDKACKSAVNKIIIAGMGGSAIAGDIIQALYGKHIDIRVVKDYSLSGCDEDTLFIACSYSGNTEETISCLNKAVEAKAKVWGITTGGLVKACLSSNYPLIELRPGFPPRAAIAYLFFSIIKVLEIQGIVEDQSNNVKSVISSLMTKAGALTDKIPTMLNFAKSSAVTINGKIPLIYAANPMLAPVAYRWKCQINENAKYPAFYHTFPEMNHNEIEAWENTKLNQHFMPIILKFFSEDEVYEKRLTAFKKLLTKQGIEYLEFFADGDNSMVRLFSLIYLGDMISYYLAIINDTNPTSIKFIDFLKENI